MKKTIVRILTAFAVIFNISLAHASTCYTASEFEAEQGLRIHSELMVIGLTCAKMPQGQALYSKYQAFTRKNQRLISGYETSMISYFRKTGVPDPEATLHTFRTTLANGISKHAVSMSTSSFCKNFGTRIDKALAMDQQKLRSWAQHVWPQTPTQRPKCVK